MYKKIIMFFTVILAVLSLTVSSFALTSDSSVMQPDTSMPYYDGDSQETPSSDEYFSSKDYYSPGNNYTIYDEDYFGFKTDKTTGYVFIILLGYVLPVFLIIFSFIRFFKSKTRYKNAWFIMTATGLLTSIFSTLFMLFTI